MGSDCPNVEVTDSAEMPESYRRAPNAFTRRRALVTWASNGLGEVIGGLSKAIFNVVFSVCGQKWVLTLVQKPGAVVQDSPPEN